MTRFYKALILAVLLVLVPILVNAQTTMVATLSAPQTDSFPMISTLLEVRDEQGLFVSGLEDGDVAVLENDQRIPVSELRELRPGAQFVVAMNASTTFAIRDAQGITRYEYLRSALEGWALSQAETALDDMSLITAAGTGMQHVSMSQWLQALRNAPSDHRSATPNFQILAQAIDIAADSTPNDGMGKAVLFITTNPDQQMIPLLQALGERASNAGVSVHVWMVTSPSYFTTQGAVALGEVAAQTGGQFFPYSGLEVIPDVDAYVEPLRNIYQLSYESQILLGGAHQLAVEIDGDKAIASSAPQVFELNVLPPNPIFVSPPTQIYRSLVVEEGEVTEMTPAAQQLEILIEFPDGFERELVRTTLYVDGKIAAENTSPPFNMFDWGLAQFTESGRHTLQVEAVDDLGLSSVSIEMPVDITAQRPPSGLAASLSQNSSFLATGVVVMAGAILILVLVMAGRLRPHPLRPRKKARQRVRKKKAINDPVFQPVEAKAEATPIRRLNKWASRFPNKMNWPQRNDKVEPYAYLEWVVNGHDLEILTPTKPIPINSEEITLGADPAQATLVLEDTSIDALHARLRKGQDGRFYLSDHDSVAGTWVNYAPTQEKDTPLTHGDLIHVGRVGFRFKLHKPPKVFEPLIILEEAVI